MDIFVKPRLFFEDIKGTGHERYILDNHYVISINTPEYAPRNIKRESPPFKNVDHDHLLVLYFHDYYKPLDQVQLMSDEDAQAIKEFVSKISNKKSTLFVHCTAGISRSGAVGKFLNEFFNANDPIQRDKFYARHPRIQPNTWVYNKLTAIF